VIRLPKLPNPTRPIPARSVDSVARGHHEAIEHVSGGPRTPWTPRERPSLKAATA